MSSSFRASSERAKMSTILGLDVLHERRQFVAIAASGENRKPLGGEFSGDRAADEITGADDRGCGVSAFQLFLLHMRQWASADGAAGARDLAHQRHHRGRDDEADRDHEEGIGVGLGLRLAQGERP